MRSNWEWFFIYCKPGLILLIEHHLMPFAFVFQEVCFEISLISGLLCGFSLIHFHCWISIEVVLELFGIWLK